MKNIQSGINDRLGNADEMIIVLKDIAFKTVQLKQREKNDLKKPQQNKT